MNTFITRASTALIFGIVVVGSLLFSHISFVFLMLLIMLGCLFEFFKIAQPLYKRDNMHSSFYRNLMLPVALYFFAICFFVQLGYISTSAYYTILLLPGIFFLIELIIRSKRPFRNIGLNLIAFYYIVFPLSWVLLLGLYNGKFTGGIVLGVLFIIWANDSGAYIVGSTIGKNKLIKHVSPNKSIEGFLGGGFFSFFLAYANIHWWPKISFLNDFTLIKPEVWYIIAGITFLFATSGDLVESLLKRSIGIKDSGSILPGHGGFLDRFDAFLFVIPFVVAAVKIFN